MYRFNHYYMLRVKRMRKIILFFLILICFFYSKEIFAQENVKQDVLVIYSTKDE